MPGQTNAKPLLERRAPSRARTGAGLNFLAAFSGNVLSADPDPAEPNL